MVPENIYLTLGEEKILYIHDLTTKLCSEGNEIIVSGCMKCESYDKYYIDNKKKYSIKCIKEIDRYEQYITEFLNIRIKDITEESDVNRIFSVGCELPFYIPSIPKITINFTCNTNDIVSYSSLSPEEKIIKDIIV